MAPIATTAPGHVVRLSRQPVAQIYRAFRGQRADRRGEPSGYGFAFTADAQVWRANDSAVAGGFATARASGGQLVGFSASLL